MLLAGLLIKQGVACMMLVFRLSLSVALCCCATKMSTGLIYCTLCSVHFCGWLRQVCVLWGVFCCLLFVLFRGGGGGAFVFVPSVNYFELDLWDTAQ